jgi:hypothetical protein
MKGRFEMKRKNIDYGKVMEAVKSGEMARLKAVLVFDNDGGYWRSSDDSLSDDEFQAKGEELEEMFGRPNGYADLVDLAQAAGIPSEWC